MIQAFYDLLNRLSVLEHEQGSTVLSTYDYAYDGLSRFTSIDSSIEGLSSFEYDASGQLTDADHASQTDEAYTYNANGSRSMTGYTTSTNNRTTAMPGFTFSYDDEGNRTRKTETSTGHVQDHEWDHRNRLTSVKFRKQKVPPTYWGKWGYLLHCPAKESQSCQDHQELKRLNPTKLLSSIAFSGVCEERFWLA